VNILGISAFFHDSAAALVQDGELVAAVQEERFSRRKHDSSFPLRSIAYCLRHGGVAPDAVDLVVYYEKPITTFTRLLRTNLRVGPKGFRSFQQAMPQWLRSKLWVSYHVEKGLRDLGYDAPGELVFTEHHESHAASAFFPSPFEQAAILTFDGVGEWATASIGVGRGNRIELDHQLEFPDSIGMLYSAFTFFCGFRVNSGEYKLMGLAPYGEPRYVDRILDELLTLHPDGSFELHQRFFDYLGGRRMTNRRFARLFDGPPRVPESEITRRECDLARSVQVVTEEIVLRMAAHAHEATGQADACLAGGVALNCVANGRLLREGPFDRLWIQPASGDAGGAVGAALYGWYQHQDRPRTPDGTGDAMAGTYLGPSFGSDEIEDWLQEQGHPYQRVGPDQWADHVAGLVEAGSVVGLFTGRMEFGPRALGHRSIIGDPRSPDLQSTMNLKVKRRESFRPFAPAVLAERAGDYFELDTESPYMLLVADVREERRRDSGPPPRDDLRAWVNQPRSDIPAVTHVDHSARIQTVDPDRSPRFHALLRAFEARTGCGVLVNTSFNVRGEPIVCTPEDAYRCFMQTEMDHLVLEDLVLAKADQPPWDATLEPAMALELD
jgi:carbamoyltransferase